MRQSLNLSTRHLDENGCQNDILLIKEKNCFITSKIMSEILHSPKLEKRPQVVPLPILSQSKSEFLAQVDSTVKTETIFLGEINFAIKCYCWIRETNVE